MLHARPYHGAAKGKIERWFRTVRMQFIPLLEQKGVSNLEDLNYHFHKWIEKLCDSTTVSLNGRLFEVGSGSRLAGEKVTLRYDLETLDKNLPKVVHKGHDLGEAKRLDQAANMHIRGQPIQKTFHDLERRNK